LEGSNLGEWDWNRKTNTIHRNARWAEMLGYTAVEINDNLQQGIDLQHPDDRENTWKAVQSHLDGNTEFYSVEYRMRTKSGMYKWIRDCGKIMARDELGHPLRVCGTHADIDEQKKAEEKIKTLLSEKELLLKEVHHRIKNNMNTISSLLSIQANTITDPGAITALEDAGRRIHSMSLLYDKLYRSISFDELSFAEYFSSLVDEIVANFPNGCNVTVKKHLEDFMLDAKRLQTLGIVVNELLTNTMKYAFKGREHGLVTVSAAAAGDTVVISIQDDGIGMPASVSVGKSTGFGLQLVDALAQQLGGKIRIERENGTNVVLEFKK
jgi:PAS domain S-box-containing protein